ncbi:hypothetical protein [Streptomyces sp. NEAU-YJ-81]|uniref:hypothetical protein n=1 Tax=Streptomyces sp. NEAU-YJ-81 TaxID=2820288 RepID=UPI001ABD1B3D|nr:hypothetical protein [Streptomyces sp. NEAU-YJ-81]MBO3676694.1 hypothetical protein [Streptomyces sp. NEAU-YJ-81]
MTVVRTFKFRKRFPSGGLAADLSASSIANGRPHKQHIQIHRKIYLSPPPGINWKDLAWLCVGVSLHSENLSSLHPEGIEIAVHRLTFPLSDYRSEVAALAIDGWLREEFHLPDTGARVDYSPETGSHAFYWGDAQDPFADNF